MAEVLLDQRIRQRAGLVESGLVATLALGFLSLPVLVALNWAIVGEAEVAVAALVVPAAVVAGVIGAWRVFGRERVISDNEALHAIRQLGPIRREHVVSFAEIAEVLAPDRNRRDLQSDAFGVGHRAILVKSRSGAVRCGFCLPEDDARQVAQRIDELVDERRRRTRG